VTGANRRAERDATPTEARGYGEGRQRLVVWSQKPDAGGGGQGLQPAVPTPQQPSLTQPS
jgi:hypothetical protein